MSQHDFDITTDDANTGTTMRTAINDALQALVSLSSDATEPSAPYAYQLWADTTTGLLKIRNAANDAWIITGTLASNNLGLLALSGGTMTGLLNLKKGTDIASATTIVLSTATGNLVHITGATETTAVTMNSGQWQMCIADGAWPLTYHATNLKINGGVSYTCAAGDRILFHYDGTTVFATVFTQAGIAINSFRVAASVGGTVDAVTAVHSPAFPALVNGMRSIVRAAGANTSATPTFAPDGLTAKTIVKENLAALLAGDITGAGHEIELIYNSTADKWILLNPKAAGAITSKVRVLAGAQTIATGTNVKLAFATEHFDTDSIFDNVTNYRATPTKAGYYLINLHVVYATSGIAGHSIRVLVYKNGVFSNQGIGVTDSSALSGVALGVLVYCNGTTDYLEGWTTHSYSGSLNTDEALMSIVGPL